MAQAAVFPIGYVSITTGLSAHVLRAWERRYGAVKPGRSASGRRLYSQEDIDRLLLLKVAVDQGNSISQIAVLDDATLAGLTGLPSKPPLADPLQTPSPAATRPLQPTDVIDTCLQATAKLDDALLFQTLQKASLNHSRQSIIDAIIVPFMAQVGVRWSKGMMRMAHEHLATSVVQACLSNMVSHQKGAVANKPRMLIATPAGQWCSLGALSVAVTAQDQGWEPAFLGPDLPSEEIAAARLIIDPQLIALSITCRVNDAFIENELQRLGSLLDGQCPFVVGGIASNVYRRTIETAGGEYCPTTTSLIERFALPTAPYR